MKKMHKKGIMQQLGGLGVGIVTLLLALTIGFLIMSSIKTQIISTEGLVGTNASHALNATNTLITATATIPGWVSLIVIAVIGALLLGLVRMFK